VEFEPEIEEKGDAEKGSRRVAVNECRREIADVVFLRFEEELVGKEQLLEDAERRIGRPEIGERAPQPQRFVVSLEQNQADMNARNGSASEDSASSVMPGATEMVPGAGPIFSLTDFQAPFAKSIPASGIAWKAA